MSASTSEASKSLGFRGLGFRVLGFRVLGFRGLFGVPFWGVPRVRIKVFRGPYWGTLILTLNSVPEHGNPSVCFAKCFVPFLTNPSVQGAFKLHPEGLRYARAILFPRSRSEERFRTIRIR